MTPTEFASFKYQHTDPASLRPKRRWFVGISLALALLVILTGWVAFPGSLALLLFPVVALAARSRQLQLGPRYLLCGNSIVYYANVNRLTLSGANGTLRLQSQNGKSFVLERDKFPTGARKADKIAKNKAAKFDKVSAKIIEKVRKANGDADVSGA